MTLFEFDNWKVSNLHGTTMIYHTCKFSRGWPFPYRYFRKTNCSYCLAAIPKEVVFLLEMIK